MLEAQHMTGLSSLGFMQYSTYKRIEILGHRFDKKRKLSFAKVDVDICFPKLGGFDHKADEVVSQHDRRKLHPNNECLVDSFQR